MGHRDKDTRGIFRPPVAGPEFSAIIVMSPEGAVTTDLAQEAAEQGLQVRALSTYYLGAEKERGLVVGYAYVPTDKIAYYGRLLGNVVKAASAGRR